MSITTHLLQDGFAAKISGCDLREPLDDERLAALWQVIDTYSVLVFHDQCLRDDQSRDFAARFAPS